MNTHKHNQAPSGLLEFYPALKRYCKSLTKNAWDAEDLAQETVLKVFKKYIAGASSQQSLITQALLNKVAKNQWIDQLKSKEEQKCELVKEPSYEPFKHMADLHSAIEDLLKHFTEQQVLAFVLKEVFQHSQQEISAWLSISEGAVKGTLFRIRTRLRTSNLEKLKKEDPYSQELLEIIYEAVIEQSSEKIMKYITLNPVLRQKAYDKGVPDCPSCSMSAA
ncbi:sigma-70 family RNA polymerase sigma factor [Falsibacillus albus]|uniref:sigma-70 family RNA polymerase sigma factor n=1 Tax=Falsibacillus albus TaxID=2478915 RepID=UPI001313ED76|nr:sigma-70 family RNA polymerase sigma factor [Falsibacillus albus]